MQASLNHWLPPTHDLIKNALAICSVEIENPLERFKCAKGFSAINSYVNLPSGSSQKFMAV